MVWNAVGTNSAKSNSRKNVLYSSKINLQQIRFDACTPTAPDLPLGNFGWIEGDPQSSFIVLCTTGPALTAFSRRGELGSWFIFLSRQVYFKVHFNNSKVPILTVMDLGSRQEGYTFWVQFSCRVELTTQYSSYWHNYSGFWINVSNQKGIITSIHYSPYFSNISFLTLIQKSQSSSFACWQTVLCHKSAHSFERHGN